MCIYVCLKSQLANCADISEWLPMRFVTEWNVFPWVEKTCAAGVHDLQCSILSPVLNVWSAPVILILPYNTKAKSLGGTDQKKKKNNNWRYDCTCMICAFFSQYYPKILYMYTTQEDKMHGKAKLINCEPLWFDLGTVITRGCLFPRSQHIELNWIQHIVKPIMFFCFFSAGPAAVLWRLWPRLPHVLP